MNSDDLPIGAYLQHIVFEDSKFILHFADGSREGIKMSKMTKASDAVARIIEKCDEKGKEYGSVEDVTELYLEALENRREEERAEQKTHIHKKDSNLELVEEGSKEVLVSKYRHKRQLHEAVLVDGSPAFLYLSEGQPVLKKSIAIPGKLLIPPGASEYVSKAYEFSSLDEIKEYIERAQKESLDRLFLKVKRLVSNYVDADKTVITTIAADIVFTYFQDTLGQTHYLMFIGDNGTGKTNALISIENIGYRAFRGSSITSANVYTFYGSIQEGQGILLEDEADSLDFDFDLKRIYKVGYTSGNKVARIDNYRGRRQDSFYTFGFKAFCAEKMPDKMKSKGFLDRTFIINCRPGRPRYDISEVINPAGDKLHAELLEEILDCRKLLLAYRLVNQNLAFPNIQLALQNREKQLCKPLLRLFQDSECHSEISQALTVLLGEKRRGKNDTLEAQLIKIVVRLVRERGGPIPNTMLWETIKSDLQAQELPGKPHSCYTDEYGVLSKKKILSILEDKFGGKRQNTGEELGRIITFDEERLSNSLECYDLPEEIEILPNTSNASDSLPNVEAVLANDVATENRPDETHQSTNGPPQIEFRHEGGELTHDSDRKIGGGTYKPLEPLEVLEQSPIACPKCSHAYDTAKEVIDHSIRSHIGFPIVSKLANRGIEVPDFL